MKLDAVTRSPADIGGRFYLTGYLPTNAAALFLLLLVWQAPPPGAAGPATGSGSPPRGPPRPI